MGVLPAGIAAWFAVDVLGPLPLNALLFASSLVRLSPVVMDFLYGSYFGGKSPEAYERLILDAILGDSTLFIRGDEVEASWARIDRLLEGWGSQDPSRPLPEYASGTWGPSEADVMLARDGRTWRRP